MVTTRGSNFDANTRCRRVSIQCKSTSGRLYAQGVSLQVAPRDIKRTALNGQWEYDIENAHFDIFTQMAAAHGLDCPHIRHYTTNKQAVRSMLACELGLTIDQVKACLLSAMYGARASERGANAIPHAIGQEKSRALYRHPIFRDILTEIRIAEPKRSQKCVSTYPGSPERPSSSVLICTEY